jgi:hypothetical protein
MFFKKRVHNVMYCYAAVGYGTIRKLVHVHDAKVPVSDASRSMFSQEQPQQQEPMFLTTKLLVASVCGLASVYWWPYYALQDLNRLEMRIRDKRPEDYGERPATHAIEYLFT